MVFWTNIKLNFKKSLRLDAIFLNLFEYESWGIFSKKGDQKALIFTFKKQQYSPRTP